MKTVLIPLVLPLLLLSACHPHVRTDSLPPVPVADPAPDAKSASAPSTQAESASEATPPASEPFVPPPDAIGDEFASSHKSLVDAYFDFDQHNLRDDARRALQADSSLLRQVLTQMPSLAMTVEGHCDERGSAEYNLALGAMRADAARQFLAELGIPSSALKTISYGKERPQCTEATEQCWQKNRRAHLTPVQ